MHKDLFEVEGEHRLSHIDYSDEIPAELTKENYIKMHRQVWATIRYDFYQDLLKTKSKENRITEEQF